MRRHETVAFRVALLITRRREDAEDASQEAFLKAWRALDRFRSGAPFRPWLLRIVANEARNRRRSLGRRRELQPLEIDEVQFEPRDVDPMPEDRLLSAERRRELLLAIERLSHDDRLVIGLRYFLELSEAETAEALGVARGTVKSRLSRALERLRQVMGAER